ncbi:unnamed protein product [Protopolystoma xenopodis]|uniref:Uncharacterized protein n=1 Tax=Protopolystoma xenopodis TaxID=117903 RepID=A0A448X609_9PLAT|nr:unnamed protein product [Protopolystoma xenopodis]
MWYQTERNSDTIASPRSPHTTRWVVFSAHRPASSLRPFQSMRRHNCCRPICPFSSSLSVPLSTALCGCLTLSRHAYHQPSSANIQPQHIPDHHLRRVVS